MSGTATPIFPQTVVNATTQLTGTTGTSPVNLIVGGSNGTKIESINATNSGASVITLNLGISNGSTTFQLSQFSIAASAGSNTTVPAVTLLNNTQFPATAYDNNGNKYIYVANGYTLTAAATATFAGTMSFLTQGGSY